MSDPPKTSQMDPIRIAVAGTGFPDVIEMVAAIQAAGRQPVELLGFLDDNPDNRSRDLGKYQILGGFSWVSQNQDVRIFNAVMRSMELRRSTSEKLRDLGAQFTSLVHPTASVDYARLGENCYVGKNVGVEFGSSLGDGSVIMPNATVGHHSAIGRYCYLGPGVHVLGYVKIEDEVFLSAGAVVHPRITVRKGCTVDVNGVITVNTKAGATYFNNRMRHIERMRHVDE